ncbi:uncharacterized protein BDZ99DRAFT_518095 [Mytilinidion resinicola]|uniref:Uncharacterized protein n=1 Tax=Mytilinidion resinicola TaxID=574789 RepID=A0A6A6YTF8_9PEZI|nr:uncharacterized protein BDZ99DRAFT_518095 [Mytilinidion resinicola]KAF2812236.1 hypothetical protein BDZ99DRAFT_518095 [Mytilinidion resinicola]
MDHTPWGLSDEGEQTPAPTPYAILGQITGAGPRSTTASSSTIYDREYIHRAPSLGRLPSLPQYRERKVEHTLDDEAQKRQNLGSAGWKWAESDVNATAKQAAQKDATPSEPPLERNGTNTTTQLPILTNTIPVPPLPAGMTAATPCLPGIPWELRKQILDELFEFREGPIGPYYYASHTFFIQRFSKSIHTRSAELAWLQGPNAVFHPPPPSPDYTTWPMEDNNNLLEYRGFPIQSPNGGDRWLKTKLKLLRQWDCTPRSLVFMLTKQWLLRYAYTQLDPENTVIINPEIYPYSGSHLGDLHVDRHVEVMNVPKRTFRPLIHSIAINIYLSGAHLVEVLFQKVDDVYLLRKNHSFTGLKSLMVNDFIEEHKVWGRIRSINISFEKFENERGIKDMLKAICPHIRMFNPTN